MAGFSSQLEKIDNLSTRERVILLVGGLIVFYMLWSGLFNEPLQKEKRALRSEIEQMQNESDALALQLQVLSGKKQPDPNQRYRQRREQLQAEIKDTKNEIVEATANLVAPERMPKLLRSVLEDVEGLQLVSLSGIGKTPLITRAKDEDGKSITDEESEQAFETHYRHGMKIVFEGDFLTTLEYIRKLESLEWRFFWDSIELDVKEYPRAVSSVTFYTLSLDQNWIGI